MACTFSPLFSILMSYEAVTKHGFRLGLVETARIFAGPSSSPSCSLPTKGRIRELAKPSGSLPILRIQHKPALEKLWPWHCLDFAALPL